MAKTNSREGFTLLEVMISLAILASLVVTAMYTLNYHMGVADRQETSTVALMLAKGKLSELKPVAASDSGSFEAPYDDYRYVAQVNESSFSGVFEARVTVRKDKEEVMLRKLLLDPKTLTDEKQ